MIAAPEPGPTERDMVERAVTCGPYMYAGRAPSFFRGELAAIMIGAAYAAADEYARVVAGRPLTLEPDRTRADLHDYQRHLGEALGVIHTAEVALRRSGWRPAVATSPATPPSPSPRTTASRSCS
ncbi:hypothetical protein [Streptomyces viridochromogenes]|uniref:hypothetical protein n=1 Tax=Streptomyces viridochromogenes TaxID=1938 RepID=UPI00030F2DBB|nr:hypothetical protein [Streptomyces viridochromogenes]